jgi:lysophospholipase L1-like esterase
LVLLGAVVAGVTLALALGAGEAAVRYRERHRTVVPGTLPTLFYRHYRLRHAMVRDFSYFGWVGIDSLGFRRTPVAAHSGARPVILIVGGSTVFDSQVTGDERAWPARLESRLRNSAQGFTGDILNGGVPGYLVVDNLIRLETELAEIQPDLLVVYEGHNDLFTAFARPGTQPFTPRPGRAQTLTPWIAWLEEHSLLYSKVMGRLQAMRSRARSERRAGRPAPVDWNAVIEAGARRFERDLEALLAVASARKIPVALVTITHVSGADSVPLDSAAARNWMLTVGGAPAPAILQAYRRYNAIVRATARRHGLPMIDGAASGVAGPDFYAEDDPIHFNDAGADRFAEFLAPHMTKLVAP